jgi:hypothetical protein
LIALKAQAISTTAALGVIGLVVGTVAAAFAIMGNKTRDYTQSIEGWDSALQSAQGRLRDLEDAGEGASSQAGELRQEIEYLTDAIQEFSDLEKTNIVTETQLNEAWKKRSDSLSEFTELEQKLADATEREVKSTSGGWEAWYDNLKQSFFLFGSTNEAQMDSFRAELADTSQDIQEITNNVIELLEGETFTVEELRVAYATADDELRVLIQSAIDFKEAADLEEVTKEADANLKDAISDLEELYGLRANESKSLIEQFEDETDARRDSLNDQLDAVRDNSRDAINQYQKEYNARVKLLDAETEAVVGALQDQLDALDDAAEDATFEDEKTRIENELAEAWTRKDKARLEEELATFLAKHAQDIQKKSLQEQIRDVQDAANRKKAEWQEELDTNIEHQNAILEASEITIQSELTALENAMIAKRSILQQELNDAVAVQNAIRDNAIAAINTVLAAQMISSVPLTTQGAIDMQSGIDYENWAASSGGGIRAYANGGAILEPTLLSSLRTGRPYAIAGENGPERVVPGGGGDINITGTFYIREEADIPKVARELHRLRMRKGNMGS